MACCLAFSTCASIHCRSLVANLLINQSKPTGHIKRLLKINQNPKWTLLSIHELITLKNTQWQCNSTNTHIPANRQQIQNAAYKWRNCSCLFVGSQCDTTNAYPLQLVMKSGLVETPMDVTLFGYLLFSREILDNRRIARSSYQRKLKF